MTVRPKVKNEKVLRPAAVHAEGPIARADNYSTPAAFHTPIFNRHGLNASNLLAVGRGP